MESSASSFQRTLVARASAARDAQLTRAAKRKRVLDEDEFVAALDRIIERDYFPGLPLLRAQHELLLAIEADDPERARRAYAMVGAATPAAHSSRRETPGRVADARECEAASGRPTLGPGNKELDETAHDKS